MADFETIDLDPSTKDVAFHKSDYALVIFNNIAEIYSTDGDIECRYTVTSTLQTDTRDWVGLYKVGWRSSRDYVYFEWAPAPKDSEPGTDHKNVVVFKGKNLPKDDGEFYQFCYVTSSGQVRGASTPFQFKRPLAEEYVEVEAEDGELLVVKTKTAVLQEKLKQSSVVRDKLTKDVELLEQERDGLLSKLVNLEKHLADQSEERQHLSQNVKAHQEQVVSLTTEAKDMQLAHDALREKINVLNQEKASMEKRLDDNDVYLRSLQEKIKALINEKDALTGKNKALEEEKELCKSHFMSTESTLKCYVQEMDKLKEQLEVAQQQCTHLREQVNALTDELGQVNQHSEQQAKVMEADKEQLAGLEERTRNAEDKLRAAEHCKVLLNEEVLNVQEVCRKVSLDLENSRSEAHSLKTQLTQQEDTYQAETQRLQGELSRCKSLLHDKEQERSELEQELVRVRSEVAEREELQRSEQAGPMFALQTAQTNLKERYTRMKQQNEELRRQVQELVQKQCEWEEQIQTGQREAQDLRERLTMGQEEYKAQFIQCRKLQAQIRKLSKQGSPARSESSTDNPKEDFVEVKVMTSDQATEYDNVDKVTVCTLTETAETGHKEIQTEAGASGADSEVLEEVADLTTSELQQQLEDLGRELSHRNSKKHKYKQLLQEEKEKNLFLQRHYFDELKKKDEEVRRLTEQLTKTEEGATHRISTLEKKLAASIREKRQVCAIPISPPAAPLSPQAMTSEVVTSPPALYPNPYAGYTPVSGSAPTPSAPPQEPPTEDTGMPPSEHVKEFDPLLAGEGARGLQNPLQPLPPPMTPEMTTGAKVAAIKAKQNSGVGLNGIMEMCDSMTEEKKPVDPPSLPTSSQDTPDSQAEAMACLLDSELDPLKCETDTSYGAAAAALPVPGPTKPAPGLAQPGTAPRRNPSDTRPEVEGDEETEFVDAQGDPQKMCPICTMTFPAETSDLVVSDHIDDHYGPVCPICHRQFEKGTEQSSFQEHVEDHFD